MLNVREWGSGPKKAVLIHGIMSDSGCWWQVGPDLADRGYHVLAVDLPGHGHSDPMHDATVERMALEIFRAVPADVDLAIAHSMGTFILGTALEVGTRRVRGRPHGPELHHPRRRPCA